MPWSESMTILRVTMQQPQALGGEMTFFVYSLVCLFGVGFIYATVPETKAKEVTEKLKIGEQTAIEIDRVRNGYRPAARRGALLFFVLSEMALINNMYQFSLSSFLDVFEICLKNDAPGLPGF